VLEAKRVADLVHGRRAQVLDIALTGADLREHVDDGIVDHLAGVRTDAVRLVVVQAQQ